MKLIDGNETVVVVTGTSEAAISKDGPLAEWLRDEIDRRGEGQAYRRAVVVADERYVQNAGLQAHPTIAIGGPGANGVVQHLSQVLPMVLVREDRMFVQMAAGDEGRQAALWGMDGAATREAVEAFVSSGLLDRLLGRVWLAPGDTLPH